MARNRKMTSGCDGAGGVIGLFPPGEQSVISLWCSAAAAGTRTFKRPSSYILTLPDHNTTLSIFPFCHCNDTVAVLWSRNR